MTNKMDRAYFSRRAAQEREAALKTASSASVIHADLAARYAQLAEGAAPAKTNVTAAEN